MYVNQPIHAEKFKSFCQQLSDFTEALANERSAVDKMMKQMESQQLEAETAFAERVAEDKAKFAAQREQLERELHILTETNDKLCAQKKDWELKQAKASEELMAELDRNDIDNADAQFGDHFSSLIDSMNNLSYDSMNDQFTVIKNNLDELNIEKEQLKLSIADQKKTIAVMTPELKSTCGVTYKERNAFRISLLNQINKVRAEYQTCRLQEQALKAKLAM
uniref:M protein n=1 Tax=Caenorhabditis tropicalis TaxID=1561998 RepID=A0A1I7V4H4_9PELO